MLRTILVSTTLLTTIVLALVIGVAAGYGALLGILHLFRGRREQPAAPALAAADIKAAGR